MSSPRKGIPLSKLEAAVYAASLDGHHSHKELAGTLGVTVSAVSCALYNARRKLGESPGRIGRPKADPCEDETSEEAEARVLADVAAGVRCSRCWSTWHTTADCDLAPERRAWSRTTNQTEDAA